MPLSRSYHDDLIKDLRNPREASAYLNAALEEGDRTHFLLALRNVAEAHGGLLALSRKSRMHRGNLYRMLSKGGNPELQSLNRLLGLWGLRLAVEVESGKAHRRAA